MIVVTYNSARTVAQTLTSAFRALPGAELLVVDNGSTDGTLAAIAASETQVRVITGHGNVGFGAGCNLGAQAATRDFLLFLNPDVVLSSFDDDEIGAAARRPSFGIFAASEEVGSRVRPLVNLALGPRSELALYLGRAFLLPAEFSVALPKGRPARQWVSGAAFLVRRSEFARVRGFDERYFLYFEDRDLSDRYALCNLPVASLSGLRIVHAAGTGSDAASDGRVRWGLLSLLQYFESGRTPDGRGDVSRTALRWIKLLRRTANFGGRVPGLRPRAVRKAEQLHRLESQLRLFAMQDDRSFYPDAAVGLARAFGIRGG